jgi:hypothetical protein
MIICEKSEKGFIGMAVLHDFVVSTQPRPPDGVRVFTWVLLLLGVEEFC